MSSIFQTIITRNIFLYAVPVISGLYLLKRFVFDQESREQTEPDPIFGEDSNRSNIIDELRKKQENLKREIKKEEELIRINRTKSRKVALKALQRKKLLESRLKRNKGALQTLIYGSQYSETKQPIINNVSSDEIVTNDIVLTLDAAQNVSHIISNPMGFSQDFDEEELIKELEEMENQEINSSIEPSLATKSDSEEEDELNILSVWADNAQNTGKH